jgi:hypothetical protein
VAKTSGSLRGALGALDHVVFYWAGQVPEISELAIASSIVQFPTSTIHLFLDTDKGFESSLPESHNWLVNHPRVVVHSFSLDEVLNKHGFPSYGKSRNPVERLCHLVSTIFRDRLSKTRLVKRTAPWLHPLRRLIGHYHPIFGWFRVGSLRHSIVWGGRAYRSDVFRVVIEREFPRQSVLYSDLDVYFAAPEQDWDFRTSFSYRGGATWANTAILYMAKDRPQITRLFLEGLQAGLPALPWHFFTDQRCSAAGITVHPVDRFDPGWNPNSVTCGDSTLFFAESADSQEFLQEIRHNNLAVHWHNQWFTEPGPGSTFQQLLLQTRSALHGPRF